MFVQFWLIFYSMVHRYGVVYIIVASKSIIIIIIYLWYNFVHYYHFSFIH